MAVVIFSELWTKQMEFRQTNIMNCCMGAFALKVTILIVRSVFIVQIILIGGKNIKKWLVRSFIMIKQYCCFSHFPPCFWSTILMNNYPLYVRWHFKKKKSSGYISPYFFPATLCRHHFLDCLTEWASHLQLNSVSIKGMAFNSFSISFCFNLDFFSLVKNHSIITWLLLMRVIIQITWLHRRLYVIWGIYWNWMNELLTSVHRKLLNLKWIWHTEQCQCNWDSKHNWPIYQTSRKKIGICNETQSRRVGVSNQFKLIILLLAKMIFFVR